MTEGVVMGGSDGGVVMGGVVMGGGDGGSSDGRE